MITSAIRQPASEFRIIWAVIASILLHSALAVIIPNITFDSIKTPDVLEVALVKKPEPPPPALPEIITPPPEVATPKIEPKIKPLPKPVPKPTPAPKTTEPLPQETPPPAPMPEVIAVTPALKMPEPTHVVPVPEPIKQETPPPIPPKPDQADIDNARSKYGNSLWGAISQHKRYPRIAQMRGWQGEVVVELQLDGSGKLISKKITQSSGYEALDKQALEMVEKALPFPTPPEILRNNAFTITVPVPFKLE